MSYKHGIEVDENETSLNSPLKGTSGIQVVVGTAPINMADDPDSATNNLIFANDYEEAESALGYSNDWKNYTLCQSMYASFKKFGIAPVIFINVLDPAKHVKDLESTTVTVTAKQATVEKTGILPKKVTVKNGATELKIDKDYVFTFNSDGYAVITLLSTGSAYAAASLTVAGTGAVIDPSTVKATDIIGGVDVETGKKTGIELVRSIFPKYSVTAGILIAPGWSGDPAVAAALAAKTEGLNGSFRCETFVDLPGTVKKYTDVPEAKKAYGVTDKHGIVLWPYVKVDGKVMNYSADYAAMAAYTDAKNENVPNVSPSNKLLKIDAACLEDGTEILLDEPEANTLNAVGVVTIINYNGLRAWGNNTAAFPDALDKKNPDPKDRWIPVRRFFSWYADNFILRYHDKVDDPADPKQNEYFVDSENIYLNSLTAQGRIAGGKIAFNASENPITDILNGQIKFHTNIAPFTPEEYLKDTLEFDPNILESAFSGGEE